MTTTIKVVRSVAGRLSRRGWIAALLAGSVFAPSVHAAITFAQFDESTNANTQPFTFTNSGPGSTFSGTVQGNFQFLITGLPTAPQAAIITLTSTAATPATTFGPFLSQPIDGATDTLTFTRVSDNANLLTVTFTGNLTGFDGDVSATLSSNTLSGDSLTYTSAFLDFSGTTARSLGLNVAGIDPAFTQNDNGFLDNFTADLTGGFSSSPAPAAVPEPTSVVVFGGLGAIGLFYLAARCWVGGSLGETPESNLEKL
jgi:hypothetical protein